MLDGRLGSALAVMMLGVLGVGCTVPPGTPGPTTTTSAPPASTTTALTSTTSTTTGPTTTAAPPSSTTTATTVPPPTAFPDASNTGVPDGVALRPSGSVIVRTDGAVVENLDITGELVIAANDVTVRNVRLTNGDAEAWWGILLREGYGGLVVTDSEVVGSQTARMERAILNQGGGTITVRRVELSGAAALFSTAQGLIEDNYFHNPIHREGDHNTAFSCPSGPSPGNELVVRHNTIVNNVGYSAALALYPDFGQVHDVTVENNLLAGGNYTVYGGAALPPDRPWRPERIVFRNNTFSRQIWPTGGVYGPVYGWDNEAPGNIWESNAWEDGTPVHP